MKEFVSNALWVIMIFAHNSVVLTCEHIKYVHVQRICIHIGGVFFLFLLFLFGKHLFK
jgi:hypothetical protein